MQPAHPSLYLRSTLALSWQIYLSCKNFPPFHPTTFLGVGAGLCRASRTHFIRHEMRRLRYRYGCRTSPYQDVVTDGPHLERAAALVEEAYANTGLPVYLGGHSNGPLYALALLSSKPAEWKAKYIGKQACSKFTEPCTFDEKQLPNFCQLRHESCNYYPMSIAAKTQSRKVRAVGDYLQRILININTELQAS